MSFNRVETFILHRIFVDLNKDLFEKITQEPIVSRVKTGSKYIPYEYIVQSPTTTILKNQIAVYNAISEKIQELPITENNFELIIYGLEYQYLHLKFRTLERKDVVDIIGYVISTSDGKFGITNLVESIQLIIDPKLRVVVDDFASFTKTFPNLTKTSLNHALAITYAYGIFFYPVVHNVLNCTKNVKLMRDFMRYYYLRYLQNPNDEFIDITQEAYNFCKENFPNDIEQKTNQVIDEMTLSVLSSTLGLLDSLETSKLEYKQRRIGYQYTRGSL
ncbi:hypothetical protein MG5_06218 [Candida albicans P57072]|uniref:Uncharacterized protein n=3 Tax=Candida albicans TaxID=5476 RepID=A0A1D8PTV9_CANAL|nr:uncharacterized protein CAALFM_CR09040WA [Candida albicans SC5314]KAF6068772.1 hypothetical protein FOB64_003959 [Candida albicans]KGQ80384.1 hypothetical protein MEO_06199 [Candida albicans P94015]KGQ80837.1 hypothetical protein MEU_06232 [Candida albicans P37005]KGQ99736.1 hypothetical protein MG5_06218 [Candida albicans P57072]KGR00597.1 hypothetical protein MG3_06268 [Candida albicans P78048]KGR05250.1 hypothetical protein MG9_06255 [Candida albicans P37037]KGT62826.1 hypothetical pro|eukprot:XP_716434.1 hypothetical protein CAALFM_CR09040WA [Candida albicans SC5314]